MSSEKRQQMITEAAYFLAEKNGFAGDPAAHWLEAEKLIDAELLLAAAQDCSGRQE